VNRLSTDYFEKIYAADPDPWGFDARAYEARKYALTLAALPRERYARAFEPGCSNGALTERLAPRCDVLIAADLVPSVVARARGRVRAMTHVEVRELAIPDAWPEGTFDLIVLSEVAYYLTSTGLAELLARIDGSLAPSGHWTGETDYPLRGVDVHAVLDAHPGWERFAAYAERAFALAVYERTPA
jgi:cyclopropane fatty-acyl-phospholipid synthase-like methyltransferase